METLNTLPRITKKAFDRISDHVLRNYGINLTDSKRNLVENRLMKRVRELSLSNFEEYTQHLFDANGKEELSLICDFLSTNKTYFNRESSHFDFLNKVVKNTPAGSNLSIWSSACSAGDEVYTIAAWLQEWGHTNYSILGTDISNRMLEEAQGGIYHSSRLSQLPGYMLKKHLIKVKDEKAELFEVQPELKRNVQFKKFNLIKDMASMTQKFDIIFCRNVLIYFTDSTKRTVIEGLIKKIKPGGYLLLGHCEGMLARETGLVQVQPSVFKVPS